MRQASLESLSSALIAHSAPGQTPADLLAAVRQIFPDATRREFARAALYAAMQLAETDPQKARDLQDFAIKARGSRGYSPAKRGRPVRSRVS